MIQKGNDKSFLFLDLVISQVQPLIKVLAGKGMNGGLIVSDVRN